MDVSRWNQQLGWPHWHAEQVCGWPSYSMHLSLHSSRSHLWMNNISGGILEDCPEDLVVPLKFDTKIL